MTDSKRGFARREFLKRTGLAAAGMLTVRFPAVAGPFQAADFEKLVPRDKKFARRWIESLYARGEPSVYRGQELRFIGMPIGGLCAGQLYLGGDGRLWLWDVFNQPPPPDFSSYAGPHYAKPLEPFSPIDQGFALRASVGGHTSVRRLDRDGFPDIEFVGQYPIGAVRYRAPDFPLTISLEAFSPFIPLNLDDSELPATILEFTVDNRGTDPVEVELAGWLENAVCLGSGRPGRGLRRNRVFRERGVTLVQETVEAAPAAAPPDLRPEIVFDDFESDVYAGWMSTGTAFGTGPVEMSRLPAYQGEVGGKGRRVVNSHNARQGEAVAQADAHTGTLTSRPFAIERRFINFLVGGGGHRERTCVNLLVDDAVVLSATGANENRMRPHSFDVRPWQGRTARLQIVDRESGGWGNIGIDDIVFSDLPAVPLTELEKEEDYGSLALAVLGPRRGTVAHPSVDCPVRPDTLFRKSERDPRTARQPFGSRLAGALGRQLRLQPGERGKVRFVIAWHFAAVRRDALRHVRGIEARSRSYARRFRSAGDVARYVAREFDRLSAGTRLWRTTWYDSTLPHWFLDRTLLNVSIGATATCLHFDNGRFYGWEGTYCCPGTCTHVWQYAQALSRLFPQLERAAREITDFGLAFHADTGAIDYRAEADRRVAIDGQAGTVLRAYREHLMSADNAFLRRLWPRVKKSIEYLIREDADENGILEGEQYNTLDASWYGEIPWLSSLYLAAVAAGAAMARRMDDEAFARRCDAIGREGSARLTEHLFNGEYYLQRVDPAHADAINTNAGCHIDQVYGQSWAFQVGLPRILPVEPTRSALASLWRYNFTPDVGVYRRNFTTLKGGRWYALPGEGGLLMCTWPRGGAERAAGNGDPGFVGYFNECMTGFEYQVAAHMLWEGLTEQGLAITRMIHDRYHPSKRNPWNEIECSSHYARAMASYGVYLAACGFEYDGPAGHIGFAPRLAPADFRAAFTAAEGWGSFAQKIEPSRQTASIQVRWGKVRLRSIALQTPRGGRARNLSVRAGADTVPATSQLDDDRLRVLLGREVTLYPGETLQVTLG